MNAQNLLSEDYPQSSANFDRSGFQQDVNTVYSIDRLRGLDAVGEIGSVASH